LTDVLPELRFRDELVQDSNLTVSTSTLAIGEIIDLTDPFFVANNYDSAAEDIPAPLNHQDPAGSLDYDPADIVARVLESVDI